MKAGGRHKARVRLISSLVVRKGALLGPLCDNDLSPMTKGAGQGRTSEDGFPHLLGGRCYYLSSLPGGPKGQRTSRSLLMLHGQQMVEMFFEPC